MEKEQMKKLELIFRQYQGEDGYPLGIAFQMILYTGLSLSEALAIRWSDVDFEGKVICVRNFVLEKRKREEICKSPFAMVVEPLNQQKRRKVPLPEKMLSQLSDTQKWYGCAVDDYVVRVSDKHPAQISRMRAALRRRFKAAGLGDETPSMLRDVFAMKAIKAGATSDMIAELMGFASPQQVVRKYMRNQTGDKRMMMERIYQEMVQDK